MSSPAPRVSIGLPVYNGSNFVAAAIESILGQTFRDFELIISDNQSTDGTWDIARRYAERDPRVRLHRFGENAGAASNFNRVFQLSRANCFKWAAHDDLLDPMFLEKCLEALDHNSAAVLAFPRARIIDETNALLDPGDTYDETATFESLDWVRRFHELICRRHRCYPIFGLIRAAALRQVGPLESFCHADRILLGRLALAGPFLQLPQYLFLSRVHSTASARLFSDVPKLRSWWDPAREPALLSLPHWRIFWEYLKLARDAQSSKAGRLSGYAEVLGSLRVRWWRRKLLTDLKAQVRSMVPVRCASGSRP